MSSIIIIISSSLFILEYVNSNLVHFTVYISLLYWIPPGPMTRSSNFYDRLSPPLPPKTPITVSTIASTAQDICKGRNG